jgi:poly(3-hydroxybutyrate) depolymerase
MLFYNGFGGADMAKTYGWSSLVNWVAALALLVVASCVEDDTGKADSCSCSGSNNRGGDDTGEGDDCVSSGNCGGTGQSNVPTDGTEAALTPEGVGADGGAAPIADQQVDSDSQQTSTDTTQEPDTAGTVPEEPSPGCGGDEWPPSGDYTLNVGGTKREYIVDIPEGYDSRHPYRLVFAWHGRGGTAQRTATGAYYGLEAYAAESTIFVAGQGLANALGATGWSNTNGRDIAFARAMLDSLLADYCIDEARIFSTGMSYGGFMTTTIGCQLGDVVRAIAPMSGGGRAFLKGDCVGQVAVWISHGNHDNIVNFETGLENRDHWLMVNHCGDNGTPVAPEPCLQYPDCDDGYPVHFCEFDGGHTVPAFASEGIWNFFSQF